MVIKQIVPCLGWGFHRETGIKRRIVAIGLYDNGQATFLEVTKYGVIIPIEPGEVEVEIGGGGLSDV